MTPWHMSRAQLKDDPDVGTLAPLLLPAGRADASHRLIWSLFARTGAETRSYLFRQTDRRTFLILSDKPPVDRHALFDLETKPFEPHLTAGDRLGFSLLANAVTTMRVEGKKHGKRVDIATEGMRGVAAPDRAAARGGITREAGEKWLAAQGQRHGFMLAPIDRRDADDGEPNGDGRVDVVVQSMPRLFMRRGRAAPWELGVYAFDGTLEVTDPVAFRAALHRGFGKAKAYGLGLMLIRRV